MKLLRIEDYDLNTYKFHFEGSISAMGYTDFGLFHIIAVYEHNVHLNCDNHYEPMSSVLEYFGRVAMRSDSRPRTFYTTPQFKQLLKNF